MEKSFNIRTRYPWVMLASIYTTQYIGVAFILSAAVAILRQQGIALDKLALLNLAVLPLMGKVFYAPLIDKYRLGFQGKYRSWLIIAQASMALLLTIAGLMDFQHQFSWIIVILALYTFCMSIQDVAIDGLSCKLFAPEARKLASSIQFSGNLLGNIIGGGLILMFYPWLEWHGSLWLLAALTSISLLQIVLFTELEDTANNDINSEQRQHLLHNIKDFLKQQKHWLFILALYPIGSTCGFALLNPLLIDSGWALGEVGFAVKVFGSAVGLFAALLTTPIITKFGRINAFIGLLFVQVLALLLMVPLTLGFTGKVMVYTAITIHFISFPALLVVSSTMIMDKAAQTLHKATFFTLQFSFASLLGFTYSSISMAIAKHVGYSTVVIAGVLISFAIALFIGFMFKRIVTNQSKLDNYPR